MTSTSTSTFLWSFLAILSSFSSQTGLRSPFSDSSLCLEHHLPETNTHPDRGTGWGGVLVLSDR